MVMKKIILYDNYVGITFFQQRTILLQIKITRWDKNTYSTLLRYPAQSYIKMGYHTIKKK